MSGQIQQHPGVSSLSLEMKAVPLRPSNHADTAMSQPTIPTSRQPTTFQTLPPELRHLVYGSALPEMPNVDTRVISFPFSYQHDKTLLNICGACPSLSTDVWDWIYKHCRACLNVIPDVEVHLPKLEPLPLGIEWARFSRIDLDIAHPHHTGSPGWKDLSVLAANEWRGTEQAVASLRFGNPGKLPAMRVHFAEYMRYDPVWMEEVWFDRGASQLLPGNPADNGSSGEDRGHCEGSKNILLRAIPGDRNKTVVMSILDPLLDLPPCESALIWSLSHLEKETDLIVSASRRRVYGDKVNSRHIIPI